MAAIAPESRAGRIVLALIAAQAAACVVLAAVGAVGSRESARSLELNRALVAHLGLTDLALWSEASYCRHPTQADLFAPLAEHPGALEHFPAGSMVPPPPALGGPRPAARAGGGEP